jgi:mannose-1-phosphate guanylyltransferase/mannose-6-phosphate isomerase
MAAPKQMLPLVTEKTMIQETALRFSCDMYHPPVFICAADHEPMIREQMQDLGIDIGGFLIEPVARNTAAPAVIAALHALELEDDALVLVVPADHHIEQPEAFRRAVAACAPVAAHGHLMTFGITPEYAATGFGYIRKGETMSPGTFVVDSFVEKPPQDVAESYLASGEYYWNSGIFLFHAQTLLSEMEAFSPRVSGPAKAAYETASRQGDIWNLDDAFFADCESLPVDKAVMEHTRKAGVIPCQLGWHDIGSFKALQALKADAQGLALSGNIRLSQTRDCLIETDGPLVAAVGVDNLAIIVKDGAVLVLNLDKSQDVKEIVAQLKLEGETSFL